MLFESSVAARLDEDLSSESKDRVQRATALIRHEVSHLARRDVWKLYYTAYVLQATVFFVGWALLLLLGVVIFAYGYGSEISAPGFWGSVSLDPAMRQALQRFWPAPEALELMRLKARSTSVSLVANYVLMAFLPMVTSGVILYGLAWRRLAWIREFYSDMQAQQLGSSIASVVQAVVEYEPFAAGHRTNVQRHLPERWATAVIAWINRRLPYHPNVLTRQQALADPLVAFDSVGRSACTAGVFVLLLQIVLVGPLTVYHYASLPVHFAAVAGYLLMSVNLLPRLCDGRDSAAHRRFASARPVLLFLLPQAAWLSVNVLILAMLLVFAPDFVLRLLAVYARTVSNVLVVSPVSAPWVGDIGFVVQALANAVLLFIVQARAFLAILTVEHWIRQCMLTWYGMPNADRRLVPSLLLATVVSGAAMWSLMLMPASAVLGQGASTLGSRSTATAIGLVGIAIACTGAWFATYNRRYAQRCPNAVCNAVISGSYAVGRRCAACGTVLHPWLVQAEHDA